MPWFAPVTSADCPERSSDQCPYNVYAHVRPGADRLIAEAMERLLGQA